MDQWYSSSVGRRSAGSLRPASPPTFTGREAADALDIAFHDALNRRKSWRLIYFDKPEIAGQGEFSAFIEYDINSGWDESDSYYYHPQTGRLHWQRTHEEKRLGEKWRNSNYAIHVGSIYGLPTKYRPA